MSTITPSSVLVWKMTEEFGRPTTIDIKMSFTGGKDG